MSQTNPTPDPLAVLGRLEEIEREHTPTHYQGVVYSFGPYCREQCPGGFPCLPLQLARALRVLVDLLGEAAPCVKWASIYDVSGYSDCSPDLLERIRALFDALAAAAPSREGE